MALTITDLGVTQTTAGTTAASCTASGITGTNGNLLVLVGFYDQQSVDATDPVTTVGGTWSGAWTRQAFVEHTGAGSGQYKEGVEIFTAPVSGSPSGTVIYSNPQTVSDGWMGFHLFEISGQHASPIGSAANGTVQTSVSTYSVDFGATPASDSLCIGMVYDNNQAGPAITQPSGWSEADEQAPAWGAIAEWAYKNGSAVQAPQWSGFTNSASVRVLGCALEILAAGGAPTPALDIIRNSLRPRAFAPGIAR